MYPVVVLKLFEWKHGLAIILLTKSFVLHLFLQIVDSIMALFRVDFSGRGELADRQQKLAQLLSRLQKIAEGVFVTKTVTKLIKSDNV